MLYNRRREGRRGERSGCSQDPSGGDAGSRRHPLGCPPATSPLPRAACLPPVLQASEADKNLPLVTEMRQLIDAGRLKEARALFEAAVAPLKAAVEQASREAGEQYFAPLLQAPARRLHHSWYVNPKSRAGHVSATPAPPAGAAASGSRGAAALCLEAALCSAGGAERHRATHVKRAGPDAQAGHASAGAGRAGRPAPRGVCAAARKGHGWAQRRHGLSGDGEFTLLLSLMPCLLCTPGPPSAWPAAGVLCHHAASDGPPGRRPRRLHHNCTDEGEGGCS